MPTKSPAEAAASKKIVLETSTETVKSGQYIYYSYQMGGLRTGIIRYNPKTNEKKIIVKYKDNNGYYSLNYKDKYFYVCEDYELGTSSSYDVIEKISLKGKKTKLALGSGFLYA